MDKDQVADALDEIALLLEVQGENPFRCRAYTNAARALRGLDRDLGDLVLGGGLSGIKGIGPALTEKITTLVRTGRLPYLEELRTALPPGLLEIMKVPGVGPKKARLLAERLQIHTVGELEYACRENRLLQLEGFGEQSQQRILEGIERLKQYGSRFLLGDALRVAEPLVRAASALPGVAAAAVAGSVRRRRETVRDLDLLVASAEPAERIRAALEALPGVGPLAAKADGSLSGRAGDRLPLDLSIVPPARFPAALVLATGNTGHLEELRARARALGLELDPAGLSRGDAPVPCPDEEAIYRALGLPPVPPELRQGRGEVEEAAAGRLPSLVSEADLRGILHVHSAWSDGRLPIETIVARCAALGCEYVGISDHSQSARYARGLTPESLRQQQLEIEAAQRRHPGILVFKGSEVDILPDGSLDYPDPVLETLDFVVASVHSSFGLPRAEQTLRIGRALRHRRTTILGHPTGRLLLAREPYAVDLEEIVRIAAGEGVYMELNANPHRLDLDTEACRRARAQGARFAIDPDAHDEEGLRDARFGVAVARRAGLSAADVLNTLPADRLGAALRARG
jgi:DNA polymerase (family 10)